MPGENEALHGLTCLRCDHRWWPRSPKQPVRCPKCTSPYWNRERLRATATRAGGAPRGRAARGGRTSPKKK
jgi:hypothetical protein